MKKLLPIVVVGFFSISVCAAPTIDKSNQNGEYQVNIKYDDHSHLDKSFYIDSDLKAFVISKENENRDFFKCYEYFSVSINGTPIKLNNLEFRSNGSRLYIEDYTDNEESIKKIKSKPKSYYEQFSFILDKKTLAEIKKSESVVIKICDKEEAFSSEEIIAVKDIINDYEVEK